MLLLLPAGAAGEALYDYPFTNPYEATVIGTPRLYEAPLPKRVPTLKLERVVFPERTPPEVFWYHQALQYSLSAQPGRAPLIFVIAGTGGGYDSSKMVLLKKIYYQAGFHVVCLPSPTHPNFIVTASSTQVPGHLIHDAEDLYHLMTLIWSDLSGTLLTDGIYLVGYSLGGTHAAQLARIDADRRAFQFRKVLMINPSVNVLASVRRLDGLLAENLPGGMAYFSDFFDTIFNNFSEVYQHVGHLELTEDFLYRVYKKIIPKETDLAALIGFAFRISLANMAFSADVMTRYGLLVPSGTRLGPYTTITPYLKTCSYKRFEDYLNDMLYPYFAAREPGLTREGLLDTLSLTRLTGFLRQAEHVGLFTNQDDMILSLEEVSYLERTFGRRARILPNGGHCGNMAHPAAVSYLTEFMKDGSP